jgi:hypothetical protein
MCELTSSTHCALLLLCACTQVWEAIDIAITHCWRPAVAAKASALSLLYTVADLHSDMGYAAVSVLMHVASPGLVPQCVRALVSNYYHSVLRYVHCTFHCSEYETM